MTGEGNPNFTASRACEAWRSAPMRGALPAEFRESAGLVEDLHAGRFRQGRGLRENDAVGVARARRGADDDGFMEVEAVAAGGASESGA